MLATLTLVVLILAVVILALLVVRVRELASRLDSLEQELVIQRVAGMYGTESPSEPRLPAPSDPLAKSRLRRDGLRPGEPAPLFDLPAPDGQRNVALSSFRSRPLLVVFSDPDCAPCRALWPRLAAFSMAAPELPVIVVARGDRAEILRKFQNTISRVIVVVQEHWAVSRAYATFQLPSAYHIDEDGLVASPVVVGPDEIMALAESVASASSIVGNKEAV